MDAEPFVELGGYFAHQIFALVAVDGFGNSKEAHHLVHQDSYDFCCLLGFEWEGPHEPRKRVNACQYISVTLWVTGRQADHQVNVQPFQEGTALQRAQGRSWALGWIFAQLALHALLAEAFHVRLQTGPEEPSPHLTFQLPSPN